VRIRAFGQRALKSGVEETFKTRRKTVISCEKHARAFKKG